MKAVLIVFLFSGDGFAVPFSTMGACNWAIAGLDYEEVDEVRCEYAHDLLEDD